MILTIQVALRSQNTIWFFYFVKNDSHRFRFSWDHASSLLPSPQIVKALKIYSAEYCLASCSSSSARVRASWILRTEWYLYSFARTSGLGLPSAQISICLSRTASIIVRCFSRLLLSPSCVIYSKPRVQCSSSSTGKLFDIVSIVDLIPCENRWYSLRLYHNWFVGSSVKLGTIQASISPGRKLTERRCWPWLPSICFDSNPLSSDALLFCCLLPLSVASIFVILFSSNNDDTQLVNWRRMWPDVLMSHFNKCPLLLFFSNLYQTEISLLHLGHMTDWLTHSLLVWSSVGSVTEISVHFREVVLRRFLLVDYST